MLSIITERNLKSQIVRVLIRGNNRTARQLFYEIKKQGINITERAIFKAINELLNLKIIIRFESNYEINPEWLSELSKDSTEALKKLLDKNLLGKDISELKQLCECGSDYTKGFCFQCQELVCSHCGYKELKHNNCNTKCINCKIGHQEDLCVKCGKPACLRCAKEVWLHEHQFCKKKEQKAHIGILEVDHNCWFSNVSEKHKEPISLNNFSDIKDKNLKTHSGVLKIDMEDKDKTINQILKQGILKEARLIHKAGKTFYIKTRASINKSVDELTKENNSILLNPIIATEGKEQNLIISPSKKEMEKLSKGLEEFGGKVRIVCDEEFYINKTSSIKNFKIKSLLEKASKAELLQNLQKIILLKE